MNEDGLEKEKEKEEQGKKADEARRIANIRTFEGRLGSFPSDLQAIEEKKLSMLVPPANTRKTLTLYTTALKSVS
mgnify:CR=1 FL=1